MKTLLIICDGMPDGPDGRGETPLSTAYHPGLDFLSKNGLIGLLDLEYEKTADTDEGTLKILGCYDGSYPGRGYIEALATDVETQKGDVCFRANFATLDDEKILVDRRAGRDETGLAELVEAVNNMEIDGVQFIAKHALGHRLIIVMRRIDGKPLSWNIGSNDPKKTNVPVKEIAAKTPNAKVTAGALNKFLRKANKILSEHPINKKRKVPANAILVRNVGHPTKTKGFEQRYGKKACIIGAHSTIAGVAKFLGMDFIRPAGATSLEDTDLNEKTNEALAALQKYDFVLLHVNAFDTLSHDRKRGEKTAFIERFDQVVVRRILDRIDLNRTIIAVTSDHFSNSLSKGYEHSVEPVPFVICGNGIKATNTEKYTEKTAAGSGIVRKSIMDMIV
ncbi:MAG: 2,3-bisphosphoglycerate-independent phosphoglycerate mutase [Candidatus Aenigmarchaeota archaeon]|nr:2,3-bisphosphoglycerate-independent phosphoglycerate mutase [Candidatus Aenigmarchaeota archaeon]